MEKPSMDELKQIPKKSLVKWIIFVGLIYAVYDAVYLRADSRRLMLEITDISSGLVPKMMTNIDIPLLLGVMLVCLLMAKRQTMSALALRTKTQTMWMLIGIIVFVCVIYLKTPSGIIEGYEIVHTLVIAALLEELVFRGVLFRWMEQAHLGIVSYLASGLAWGALLGIRSLVMGMSAFAAILPMALMGVVVGAGAALVYKKTDSLWLVIYLHAALSLL